MPVEIFEGGEILGDSHPTASPLGLGEVLVFNTNFGQEFTIGILIVLN